MIEKSVLVAAENGVHARPAAMIVETAMGSDSDVTISNGDMDANAKSIMEIMMLSAVHGTELKISADGPDEVQIVDTLVALFENAFGEN